MVILYDFPKYKQAQLIYGKYKNDISTSPRVTSIYVFSWAFLWNHPGTQQQLSCHPLGSPCRAMRLLNCHKIVLHVGRQKTYRDLADFGHDLVMESPGIYGCFLKVQVHRLFSFPQILPFFFAPKKSLISQSSGSQKLWLFGYFEDQHTLAIQVHTPLWESPMILSIFP